MIDIEFSQFLERELPGSKHVVVSTGNNLVVRATSAEGDFIAKKIIDTDIPVEYFLEINSVISQHIDVQKIRRAFYQEDSTYIVSEFVDGENLAVYLAGDRTTAQLESVASYLARFCEATRSVSPLAPGFGLSKVGAPTFSSHIEFLQFYAKKYWSRVRDSLVDESLVEWLDQWVCGQIEEVGQDREHRTVSIDSNMRNFIIRPNGIITLLNMPIVGYSTQSHAIASLSVHLRNTRLHEIFLTKVDTDLAAPTARAVRHLELWHILGIMSFYAVRNPGNSNEWRNWGSPVPLLHDVRQIARSLGYFSLQQQ
ncbi:hypothetical protein NQ774_20000 [Ochrobactrum sp. BD61]